MDWQLLLIIGAILVGAGALYWLIRLIWFRPLNIHHFFTRTFLKFSINSPELLTMLGILENVGINFHNARLADASDAHEQKQFRWLHRMNAMLQRYDRDRLNSVDRLSAEILACFFEDLLAGEDFRHHDYPLNQMFGAQSQFPDFMVNTHPVNNRVNARNYIKRLRRSAVKFDQILEGLKIREEKGILPPRFVIDRVLDEMRAFVAVPVEEQILFTAFSDKLEELRLSDRAKARLRADCQAAIREAVFPTYQKLINYFETLRHQATEDDGVWKLPDGAALYRYHLKSSTTTGLAPEEVHEIGLAQVARIEGEMKTIMAALGYENVNVSEQMKAFAREERFLYPNTDEGREQALADYQAHLDEIDQRLAPLFDLRPKISLKVARIPSFKEKTAPGAYYQPGTLDGKRPGVFYANLRDMNEVPKFGMKTLAYHEGIPGHHFQIAIAMGLKKLPLFRRMLPFTAYAEGWAMYAEQLAREKGAYADDPYGELGYLDSSLFRAVRLVVDTGLHHKRWTRQEAIDYMQGHTGQALESVISEVERYIVMPGQACAYKIGEIKIASLRQKAMDALGERFDIRRFHNVILGSGSMPLSILESQVDGYIEAALAEE
jgi:uncharacterized protein (DUF885 family)